MTHHSTHQIAGEIRPGEESPSYHDDFEHVSRSGLVLFAESPIDFYRQYVSRERGGIADNDALRIGTGSHAIALRDTLAIQSMVKIPQNKLSGGKRVGKAWQRFRLQNEMAGKTLLTETQYQLCKDLASAFEKHPDIGPLLRHPQADRESEWRWQGIGGLRCRLKADLVLPGLDEVVCCDLKTARSIHPRQFRHEVVGRKLWLQDAHYSAGLEDRYGLPVRFVFIAVRKTFPHRVKVFELSEQARRLARQQYRTLCLNLAECYATENWNDPGDDLVEQIELSEKDL